ncbi:response regulator [Phormidium sp. CLA17]|uniref:hybrid sensor histidine kinase/response regulator n=1 Tax=Leptolyngbya sp. Cla-17 TaxID=2803751 RepID=UPI001492A00B|nr:response regulator [Leptolyngbya sp. Cla-17]MBM0740978.1 response regulator [Leptolyngbya sp. Cla-17]
MQLAPKADILIVDDVPDNLRVLSAMLSQHGYDVRKVLNGRLALAAANSTPPDLILLDIRMEGMDGYAVCQHLKASAQTFNIPIIFLSALNDVFDKVKAFEVGGVDYITKPFQIEEVLARVKNQLAIRTLQKQLQEHNTVLESRVEERTIQLQTMLEYEALLKAITDRVRDSFDEEQILQAAVQEVATGLRIICCNVGIFNREANTETIRYEYRCAEIASAQGEGVSLDLSPEYQQILQGNAVQFCGISFFQAMTPNIAGQFAILSCPLIDEQGVFGTFRLFKPPEEWFSALEIRLVQQVANQCAIALRQARLYQAVQQQVEELERLHLLKDDFLSTVSHELRSPISNIKLATQMLEVILKSTGLLEDASSKAASYFHILQDECHREIHLINDLLDLTRLDAGVEPLTLTRINLAPWIDHLTEPFLARTHSQEQYFHVDVPSSIPPLATDLHYLERILTELLNNACKYTPPGESITLSAQVILEQTQQNPLQFIQHSEEDRSNPDPMSLRICVTNTGVEISEDERDRVFDKFYRIPNNDPWKHGGTGLGLALVKRMSEHLGAKLSVYSANQQTSFVLELPIQ